MISWLLICLHLMLLTSIICTSQVRSDGSDEIIVENLCDRIATCSACIQMRNCAWCMDPSTDHEKPRCFSDSLNSSYCIEEYYWNPSTEQRMLVMQELTRNGLAAESLENQQSTIVQISPQRIALKLKLNEEHPIQLSYLEAEDFPLDLYFLMDMSKSMESEKEKLFKLGDLLAHTVRNITSNFRVGFGSFVNRGVNPNELKDYPKSDNHYCEENCAQTYSFKNNMPLSSDTALFSEKLHKMNVSESDVSDGVNVGLEAIMQSIMCINQIGWRHNARRILVFSTNTDFRPYVDDNNLQPYDGYCHLNELGVYIRPTTRNYPSVSQINSKVTQTQISVIFAATSSQMNFYANLSNQIDGSSTGVLTDESSNVAELVRHEYSKISSSVVMSDNLSSEVKMTYSTSCLSSWPVQTNQCYGLKVGDVVNFTANIVVTSCPPNKRDWKQTFQIYPLNVNESLVVDLEILCSCPCENSNTCESSVQAET